MKYIIKYVLTDINGKKEEISAEVSLEIKEALELLERKQNAQERQDRRHKDKHELPQTLQDKMDIERTVIDNIELTKLHNTLQELTPVQRKRIILRYFHEMTLRSIAEYEGVRVKQIEKSIKSALVKLKKIIV